MPIFSVISDFLLNPWFLTSLAFWIIIFILVILLRNKKEAYSIFFPFLALFKTKKLNNLIIRIAKKKPKFWRAFWNIGIFISFGFTIYGFYFFFTNIINLIFSPSIENAIIPLIPGVTIDLPLFLYLLLPLLLILTTHEFAHGISAAIDGVEIKSTGILGVGVFYLIGFGAFVEVDERELNSTKFNKNTRLRIAAAGTYVNSIATAISLLFLVLFPVMISPLFSQVSQVYNVLPPEQGGFNFNNLEVGDAIIAIKKQGQTDEAYVYLDDHKGINLGAILNNETELKCSVGDNLTLKIYNSFDDEILEKDIILGPRYNLGIEYEYESENVIIITYNYSNSQSINVPIHKINGTSINQTSGITLEKYLTNFNLKLLNLSNSVGDFYIIEPQIVGVYVGVQTILYWMHKNDFAKFLTPFWPDFWLKELSWLFIIGFSLTLFNMMPLPVFDGDRIAKEIISSVFGSKFSKLKSKRDQFQYKGEDMDCKLTEYRVESVTEVKIRDKANNIEIILGKDNYELIDGIGDNFRDTVRISLPEERNIAENSLFEVEYSYLEDERLKRKKIVLYIVRILALLLIVGNFLLSFMKFGFNLFWI